MILGFMTKSGNRGQSRDPGSKTELGTKRQKKTNN